MYVDHHDLDRHAAVRAACIAVADQQDRIDARFAAWINDGCPRGGATAQRNMERKRDRLQWVMDDALGGYDGRRVREQVVSVLGESAWWDAYVSADPRRIVAVIDQAAPQLRETADAWRGVRAAFAEAGL